MATLYRKKSPAGKMLPRWYCFFRVSGKDGKSKQLHRATGHTTKREAQEVANRLEREARKLAGADNESAEQILEKVAEAGELALKGRLNPAHARRLIGEIMEVGGEVNFVNRTCREWVTEWLAEKAATTKPATVTFYKSTTNDFLRFMGDMADLHLEAITTTHVRDFRDTITAKGRTARTANHKVKCLRSLFGDAVKISALIHNPVVSIKQLNEIDSIVRLPFTMAEVFALTEAAPSPEWKGLILIGAFTGMRISDASSLKVGNVDLERQVINFTPRKTSRKGTVVEVPLHGELIAFFNENPPSPFAGTPLFPSLTDSTSGGRKGLSAKFSRIMENAGVSREVTRTRKDGAAREMSTRSFHSLRHTFTSWLAAADVPEEVRMKMTGHTESNTHQKYTHQEISTLRAGVDRIPNLKTS